MAAVAAAAAESALAIDLVVVGILADFRFKVVK